MSNYTKIKHYDIANGKGIRTSIFFSGCSLRCKGCFNKELWGYNVGKPFTKEVYENEIKPTMNEHIVGLSILGGEPLDPNNIETTCELVKWFKSDFPNKNIWMWSGYEFDDLVVQYSEFWSDEANIRYQQYLKEIFSNIDVLVAGRYVEEERDLTLKWCGSRNQRVIDIHKTLQKGSVVLYE